MADASVTAKTALALAFAPATAVLATASSFQPRTALALAFAGVPAATVFGPPPVGRSERTLLGAGQ